MRKLVCLLLSALFFATAACAEGAIVAEDTDALLKNPRDAYEFFMDETDGSDQLLFMLLDTMNDEETLTEDGSAIFVSTYEVSADGARALAGRTFVFTTDHGKTVRIDTGTDDPAIYYIGSFTYMIRAGTASVMSESGLDQLETVWNTACFPAVFEMTLNSMRGTEDGTSYYLITGGDGCQYEYKTDNSNRIQELRFYAQDNDDFVLDTLCIFEICEPPTLPDLLIDALIEE